MHGDRWTTDGVPDQQIESYWQDCVRRSLLALDIDVDVTGGFSGTIQRRLIGRLQVNLVSVQGTQILRRTPSIIARCAHPRYVLIRMRAGQGWLRHRSGETPLLKDECVLLDSRDPYELTIGGRSESLSFHLPVDWVESHLPDPQVAVAVSLGSRQPWAGMLRDVMEAIYADSGTSPPFLIAENLCTALALTVDAIEVRATHHSRKVFKSLQKTLADLASNCNVTASDIAQTHGLSLRYLHAIYAANGTSCGRELMRVRLERAQRLLLDPTEPSRKIDDIAWHCGFSDTSHFRRRFRALFGVSPSEMRTDASPHRCP